VLSLIPTQFKIAAIAVIAFVSFAAGWRVHAWRTDAALVHSINRTEKTRQNDIVQADKIVKTVEVEKEVIRYVTNTIIKEIPALPDADSVCFTHESLGMWNRSISAANSYRPSADAKTEAIETADSEEVATVKEVLINAAENNAVCGENAANHNALIDRLESLDGKMCYCAQ
jgi:hypothetical protein